MNREQRIAALARGPLESLAAALRVAGKKNARGVDGLGAGDLDRLPPECLEALRLFLMECERTQARPVQLAATLSALALKPSARVTESSTWSRSL